jgi:hypothetical protein
MKDYASIAEEGLTKFNLFLFKNGNYAKMIENEYLLIKTFVARKQPHNVYKACLSIVVLNLSQQEWVKAINEHEKFYEYEGYGYSKEGYASSLLIEAYEGQNEKALEKAKSEGCFKYLENPISKIARNLKIFEVTGGRNKNIQIDKTQEKKIMLFGNSDEELDSSSDEDKNEKNENEDKVGEIEKDKIKEVEFDPENFQ